MDQYQKLAIKESKKSVSWFLRNFCKLKHPSAGVLPFYPFSYQRRALKAFRQHRLNIFRKCRQSGVSKISGAFATWFAMFHPYKKILIVSRTDEDAMGFLRENVVFLFQNLPEWMQEVWQPTKLNEHEIVFPNGSSIKSLTSHPDVLRSNASSLNIIDEAAFVQGMDVMWAAGWPTLQHGGNVIVISTTNGVGNWYWSAMTDAEAGANPFNPIIINWWDMDWVIEYTDPLSLQDKRIAPRDGIRKCTTQDDIDKYGKYWSPWLEEQYRALQEQGEAWKFEQEILASFVGSGNTVVSKSVLSHIATTIKEPLEIIKGYQTYVHPITRQTEDVSFDFKEPDEGFWIWKKPVGATEPRRDKDGDIIKKGDRQHSYVMGVDIATGKSRDFSAIEVFDIDTMEQVAEFMARCLPHEFVKFIDWIGRYYNLALSVIERNNGADTLIHSLRVDYAYPNVWRETSVNDKPRPNSASGKQRALQYKEYGWSTTMASKPTLNKFIYDYIRDNDDGYTIYSKRLLKQFQTYVRKRDRLGKDTGKTEAEEGAGNFDDLVMACAMGLRGTIDAQPIDVSGLMPRSSSNFYSSGSPSLSPGIVVGKSNIPSKIITTGHDFLAPISMSPDESPDESIARHIDSFAIQLGGIPISDGRPLVTPPKHFFRG